MLRIRFSRTGKVGQPSFRIVIAEHRAPVKGRYMEILGNYQPALKAKQVAIKKDRISYWISKGAIPTDAVASLLKKQCLEGMDKYLEPRDKQKKKKGETPPESKPAEKAAAEKPVAEKPAAPPSGTAEPAKQ